MTMSAARRAVEAALVPVKLPVAARMGRSMSSQGNDVTGPAAHRSCLVLAPHPDAGTPVQVVVITDGATWPPDKAPADNIATRDAELRASCAILGLPGDCLTHLDFPETHLDTAGEPLIDALVDLVRTHRPDDVCVTSEADPHSDHAALGRAARVALRGTGARMLVYPVWQWTRPRSWKRTRAAASGVETVSTDGYLDAKRRAVAVFHSQMSAAAGGDQKEGLTPLFLSHFLGPREMFFPVPTD
jgi:LmbE family N-acetylglucosaminyl deacetylase